MQLRYELVDDLLSGLPLLQHKVLQSNVQQLEILLRVIIHEAEELREWGVCSCHWARIRFAARQNAGISAHPLSRSMGIGLANNLNESPSNTCGGRLRGSKSRGGG